MNNSELKKIWAVHYRSAEEQLQKMHDVTGLISAFNANIDAVIKISGRQIEELVKKHNMPADVLLTPAQTSIHSTEDAVRGLLKCFGNGIAEEWLIEEVGVFHWLNREIGYDKMQMGGQGGIVANVMATCGVNPVYVHTASSPKEQSQLFSDLPNLQNVDEDGNLRQANRISRDGDTPLIHWIIEFDKGDSLKIGHKHIICPKSNRFIATYDPLNFKLHIDQAFHQRMSNPNTQFEYIILSGYQMLQEILPGGGSGFERIDQSKELIKHWQQNNPEHIIHFEVASTQDLAIRRYLVNNLATYVDSIGVNERELIEILDAIGAHDLLEQCNAQTNSSNLFRALLKVYEYTQCPRIQLHMFGLYITLQNSNFRINPLQNRKGMQLAANIAASKAGTGALDSSDVLLWSANQQVSDIGLAELKNLSQTITELFGENQITETGIFTNQDISVIAIPTIIIENPITLVGMGDTISSISLVAAR